VIPETLQGWTLAKIQDIAAAGVIENDRFDLKADLQPAEHQRKTVAAFANSEGGFLVFGVTNDRRVEGVTNVELVRDFGSRIRDHLSPSVDFRSAHHPHTLSNARLVYVLRVPRSPRGPHAVYLNGAWTFLKRTAAGSNEPMTPKRGEQSWRFFPQSYRTSIGWPSDSFERSRRMLLPTEW